MLFARTIIFTLANALPSLRTSLLQFLIPITTIALFYAAALYISVVYIQSIGSGAAGLSDLFPDSLLGPIINFSLLPVKTLPDVAQVGLTRAQRKEMVFSEELKEISVGLLLGDLFASKRKSSLNVCLCFNQGVVHEDYIYHLYELFKNYCKSGPKITNQLPHLKTGKVYSNIRFQTRAFPCFNLLYDLFYLEGKKIVPLNIFDLLTPLGLCYWICDDGSFNQRDKAVVIHTQSFTREEVQLLFDVLVKKFNLKCTINKNGNNHVIRISTNSIPKLQTLLAPHMPSMMRHKIGLA